MARPTWSGVVSFGLVTVPVELYTAVRPQRVRFRQLSRDTHAPVRQRLVDDSTGEELTRDDIVKGYELDDGRFVVVEPDELDDLEPEASRVIRIHAYVEQSDIDPIFYDRAYYLAPDGEVARRPYQLLTEAMSHTGQVAVANFVMRNREYLAAIRARDGVLVLSTMHHAAEVMEPADLDLDLERGATPSDQELAMAEQLIGSMRTAFDPEAYPDRHRDDLLTFLEGKAEGRTVEVDTGRADRGNVVDLMAALEQSLQRARSGSEAAAPEVDYGSLTKSELYDLAKERDIPGRSSLSKAELIEALRHQDEQADVA
ncbi:MAG: Ku protein [Nitriliruptoraceae bacterium]